MKKVYKYQLDMLRTVLCANYLGCGPGWFILRQAQDERWHFDKLMTNGDVSTVSARLVRFHGRKILSLLLSGLKGGNPQTWLREVKLASHWLRII